MSALRWRVVTGDRNPLFMVNGTVISRTLAGKNSRLSIDEIRCFKDDEPGLRYVVRDAHTVSDADVKAGKRPEIVLETDDWQKVANFVKGADDVD